MPIILASALRYIIMAIVQLGIFTIAEKYATIILDAAIKETAKIFGMSDEEATDLAANEMLRMAESVGIFAVTLRTKLPIKIAERLGFTTKGWVRRPLTTKAQAVAQTASGTTGTTAAATSAEAAAVAKAVAESGRGTLQKVNEWASLIAKVVGIPVGTLYMLAQFIDYASWSGSAYQDTFQKFFSFFGLEPDRAMPSSKMLSADTWKRIYTYYKERGAIGITDPYGTSDYQFSAEALAMVTDKIAAAIIADGGNATFKTVTGALQTMIVFAKGNPIEPPAPAVASPSTSSTPAATQPTTTTPTPAGVLATGALGSAIAFVDVGDGYITSDEDLKLTAEQTLANYVATLPSQFHYEIAITNTFKSPGGFSMKGEMVKIVSGYYKNGTPRYRTIYKKFAVMRVYLFDRNGRKVNLFEDNLGQVNATDYTPSAAAIAAVAGDVKASAFNTSVSINGAVSNSASATAPAGATATPTTTAATSQTAATVQATPAPASPPVQASSPAPAQVPAAPTVTIAKTLPLNEAAGVPYSYGPMGTTSPAGIAQVQGVSLSDLYAVNQQWWQGMPLSNYSTLDITTMMRNYNVPPINIPASSTTVYRVNTPGSTLNLRASASTTAAVVTSIPHASLVVAKGTAITSGGYSWIPVSYSVGSTSYAGFVATEYLTKL